MRSAESVAARGWSRLLAAASVGAGCLAIVIAAGTTRSSAADEAAALVRIEEDWELVVDEPDSATIAPQVTCAFSPVGSADALYAALELNHRSQPSFAAGGLQLQVWIGDQLLASADSASHATMHHPGETVRWTNRISLQDGKLTLAVENGSSDSWGAFGGSELTITLDSALQNLNAYNPEVSVKNSGIGFASNRVRSLKLLKVRAMTATGETFEDGTGRVVYRRD